MRVKTGRHGFVDHHSVIALSHQTTMDKDTVAPRTTAARKTPLGKRASPRRTASGDVVDTHAPAAVERTVVARSTQRHQTVTEQALQDVAARTDTSLAERLSAMEALLDGASPDEVKALRRHIASRPAAPGTGLDPDIELAAGWREGGYPYRNLMSRRAYEKQKYRLQVELLKLQAWVKETGQRLVILFEGRDAAGKGGTIKRLMENLNPRGARVVALEKPSDVERGQWYFQRYIAHLPTAGEIVLFDRSWYNRAGVERVMGWCTEEQAQSFLDQAPAFEKMLVDDGMLLFKYWLTVDQEQQEERFVERRADPLKRWKLSPVDLESRARYADYTKARHEMLAATHSKRAPWTLVDFNDQRRGRLSLIRHLLDAIPEHQVPEELIEFPPLGHGPLKERFKGGLKPI
jgi:polyphosphate kinase 2